MSSTYPDHFEISLPQWIHKTMEKVAPQIHTLDERMDLVNLLAAKNVEQQTGGPFAAAVFEKESGKIISVGVNRVMPLSCSSLHAEVVCLSLAQHHLAHYDLGASDLPAHQLVVNWLPCAMCFGATLWSGIRSLVIAGSGKELEDITGFDEGPIHPEWREELEKRGIELIEGIKTEEAKKVFYQFANSGQHVYNGRQSTLLA